MTQVLERIKSTVESGSFYEAQQMYKTAYYRFRAKKQLEDGYQILKVVLMKRRALHDAWHVVASHAYAPKSCKLWK